MTRRTKNQTFENAIDEAHHEILKKYFGNFNIDRTCSCWKTNPFLWSMFCAATGLELSVPLPAGDGEGEEPLTEFECLTYFIRGYAIVRLFHLMEERKTSSVQ